MDEEAVKFQINCLNNRSYIKKSVAKILAYVALWDVVSSLAYASDPSPLQDFCVAVNDSKAAVFVNGNFCQDPKMATANDFFFPGLNILGNTSNKLGFMVTPVTVVQIGTLYVGFVTSNPDNRLISKVLCQGDVFVFPIGLIHFQLNVGNTPAVVIAALSSQNLGVITIANAVFGSKPPISVDVLTKAFQVNTFSRHTPSFFKSPMPSNYDIFCRCGIKNTALNDHHQFLALFVNNSLQVVIHGHLSLF
ncbi:unnamed protein product [Ilex paraguariensis]|uniref:Germin-like protein n=1 Tax=Ilex paraguariensis TaxID=185542 RepID=A0ABC8STL6_9AQUA